MYKPIDYYTNQEPILWNFLGLESRLILLRQNFSPEMNLSKNQRNSTLKNVYKIGSRLSDNHVGM